jgi:flagellar biosynthesis chaperone FliJ
MDTQIEVIENKICELYKEIDNRESHIKSAKDSIADQKDCLKGKDEYDRQYSRCYDYIGALESDIKRHREQLSLLKKNVKNIKNLLSKIEIEMENADTLLGIK